MKDGKIKKPYTPTPDDIKSLLDYAGEHDKGLEIAILLATVGRLRLGEICALRYEDINGRVAHISKTIIRGENNEWIEKEPKYRTANRYVTLPEHVVNLIGSGKGRIIDMAPSMVMRKFNHALINAEINNFSFLELSRAKIYA